MTLKPPTSLLVAGSILALSASMSAQAIIPIPLNYNFNGIVHAGESGLPDDPNGYRSISDRGLDFTNGVPGDPLLANYAIVDQPGQLDIVHLGNRDTVTSGLWAFQATPDGDCIGIQPAWLTNVDQSTPQTTTLSSPLPVDANTSLGILFQISDGGGTMDVTVTMSSGGTCSATVGAGDWFGGSFPGTDCVDNGNGPAAGLSITEANIDLSACAGDSVAAVTFSNRSNGTAGYAILAATMKYTVPPRRVNQIPLNYNFNGIVHAGENGLPDDPNGYRSISDRGLDFTAGVPSDSTLDKYNIVSQPGQVDIVHLGNRNTVSSGLWIFDPVADGDCNGTQPAWLPNPDQTGAQITLLSNPILLDSQSEASGIFQISNGGGNFDVLLTFASGASVVQTISGGDWFGGLYPGTDGTDCANLPAANLNITERSFDLSAAAGQILTSITFANPSNLDAGYAIIAMNVSGCLSCGNPGNVANLGGGNGPTISSTSNGNLGCDLEWTVSGATPNAPLGVIALGLGSSNTPLNFVFPTCTTGAITVPSPVANFVAVNASGQATLTLPMPPEPAFCGVQISGQYAEIALAACPVILSDGLAITIGN